MLNGAHMVVISKYLIFRLQREFQCPPEQFGWNHAMQYIGVALHALIDMKATFNPAIQLGFNA